VQKYKFDCGCSFPTTSTGGIKLDIKKVPLTCQRTWDIISQGLTKGVFQLESSLGKQWTKKLKPQNMEHLSALGALLRPGCLRALDEEGVSMTEHYCRRKNGEEPVQYFHPALKPILETTYGVLTYQEQAMAIARAIAAFDLQMADELRKAIGKKLPEEMEKVRIKFIDGVTQAKVVTKDEGDKIFGWIKESQRYSFNKSHAMCYAINGYYCAYCKAHFPVQTYTSWLFHAHDKQDPKQEVRELINEAKILDIDVLPPDILNLQPNFYTDGKVITFGLADIKGIGQNIVKKIKDIIALNETKYNKKFKDWTWFEFLSRVGPCKGESGRIGESVLSAMISVGALRHFGSNRTKLLDETRKWAKLSKGEMQFIAERSHVFTDILQAFKAVAPLKRAGGGCHSQERKQTVEGLINLLEHPASKVEDSPNWIAGTEEMLLGTAITCSRIDACDQSAINATCRDFVNNETSHKGSIILGVEIQEVKEVKTRKGKDPGRKMARVVILDGTCAVDAVCFPDAYKSFGHLLTKGNTVIVQGERDRGQGSFNIHKVWQANLLEE
jgi:DNA polymerase-3 subunit alpha